MTVKEDLSHLLKELSLAKEKIEEERNTTENLPAMLAKKQNTVGNVHKRAKVSEGKMVFFGDTNWNLVLNMMLGIQMAVRSVKGFQELLYEEPQDFKLKYYF
jgi:1-phosphatidylinositol-4-phosphate 5-kinase